MKFTECPLAGAYIIELTCTGDERGFFARTYSSDEFAARGLPTAMPECSLSFNARTGTLRGLHFQAAPHAEQKVVRCTAGAIFDVIVDLRPQSPTAHRWFGTELTAQNRRTLYVPKGFAHGFVTLRDETEVYYMISERHAPGFERGLRWDDPALGIRWPIEPTVVSARDAAYPLLPPRTPGT